MAVNTSKARDPRFKRKWLEAGAMGDLAGPIKEAPVDEVQLNLDLLLKLSGRGIAELYGADNVSVVVTQGSRTNIIPLSSPQTREGGDIPLGNRLGTSMPRTWSLVEEKGEGTPSRLLAAIIDGTYIPPNELTKSQLDRLDPGSMEASSDASRDASRRQILDQYNSMVEPTIKKPRF